MVAGPGESLKVPGCPANVWVEMWVDYGLVWVDKIRVGGMLRCRSLTRKSVP